jgi:hypothetical protein
MLEAGSATTDDEREAIYRHRYGVYVEELGRYLDRADHEGRRLVDPEDAQSDLFYVADDGEVVASLRTTWGGAGFSDRQIAHYSLAPFLAELPAEVLNIGERTMVSLSARGQDVFAALVEASDATSGREQLLISFGACEPHLVAFYGRWQRPYADRHINHSESGYLIPLIAFPQGVEALLDQGQRPGLPDCVARADAGTGAMTCSHLTDPADLTAMVESTTGAGLPPLADLGPDLRSQVLEASNLIRCAEGDRLVRRGGTAHTLYVVLEGGTTGGAGPGDRIGHSAALGMRDPDVDVVVGDDGATVLQLSERTLRRLGDEHPDAARLLVGGSRV